MGYEPGLEGVVRSYADLEFHKAVGSLIKAHSSNKQDIRELAGNMVDWKATRTALDLGCGYGWFEETLGAHLDLIEGIDCLEQNKSAFLKAASRVARECVFELLHLPAPLPAEDGSFDLVVAAYSLYFFPEMIDEAQRVLRPGGSFLVITHSEAMLEEGERFFRFGNLRALIRRFSAENGEGLLREWFHKVRWVDYTNSISFGKGEGQDLEKYILFKKEFISRDVDPHVVREVMLKELERSGELVFNKNDRIFLAER